MATSSRKLFWVSVAVQPAQVTSTFDGAAPGWCGCILWVCVMDRSAKAAAEFATHVLKTLPYEIFSERIRVSCDSAMIAALLPELRPALRNYEDQAKAVGSAFFLSQPGPGIDRTGLGDLWDDYDRGF